MEKLSPIVKYIVASIVGSGVVSFLLMTFNLDGRGAVEEFINTLVGGLIFSIILAILLHSFGERKSSFLWSIMVLCTLSYPAAMLLSIPTNYILQKLIFGSGSLLYFKTVVILSIGIGGILWIFLGLFLFKSTTIILKVLLVWIMTGILICTIFINNLIFLIIATHFTWQFIVIFAIIYLRKDDFVHTNKVLEKEISLGK